MCSSHNGKNQIDPIFTSLFNLVPSLQPSKNSYILLHKPLVFLNYSCFNTVKSFFEMSKPPIRPTRIPKVTSDERLSWGTWGSVVVKALRY